MINTGRLHEHPSPRDCAARVDAAKLHAVALRHAAIDAFCAAAACRVRRTWHALRGAAPASPTRPPLEVSTCRR